MYLIIESLEFSNYKFHFPKKTWIFPILLRTFYYIFEFYILYFLGKEDELKAAVASIGPISIAMDASQFDFEFYGGGIYNNKKCKTKNDDLDHAVLAIGYGTDAGEDYWLIKNSWGAHWGIHGYFKLARNQNNACGVATAGCYPIMY